ncbi:MAG: cytochrome P450 [Anaerolineales bacterium]|nr:cytochrome P450 [Anaerolineales bacterium]MCB0010425.1 cytochrome P450 [Anaerolineales bacterium]
MSVASRNALLSKEIPQPAGLPFLGQTLNLVQDPLDYLVHNYYRHGPLYRVQMGFKSYLVLAGLDANRLLARADGQLLESYTLFGGFARYTNNDMMLTALDGPEHRYLRKLMRYGFARSRATDHLAAMFAVVDDHASHWQAGQKLPILEMMRRLIVDQLGIMTTSLKPDGYFDDIVYYLHVMLSTEVLLTLPKWWRRLPRFRRAEARLMQLAEEVLAWHREYPPESSGRPRDLIDDLLSSSRPDGQPFNRNNLIHTAIGPYFAGVDTLASTMAFYLAALLRQPALLADIQAEVDEVLATTATADSLRSLERLHAAAVETLRRYPVTPFTPRVAAEPFEFAGYEIPAGAELMFAQTVTHFLPEYYPDPYRFDINRFMDGNKNRITNVFTPFTVGAHTCLGAGLAEVQMLVTMAALLRRVEFEPLPANEPLRIWAAPLPNPGAGLTATVRRLR